MIFNWHLLLVINVLITSFIYCFGFIHTASLRLSLHREKRLQFNTNLILFTGTRKFGPNSQVANAFPAWCRIMCYSGGQPIYRPRRPPECPALLSERNFSLALPPNWVCALKVASLQVKNLRCYKNSYISPNITLSHLPSNHSTTKEPKAKDF